MDSIVRFPRLATGMDGKPIDIRHMNLPELIHLRNQTEAIIQDYVKKTKGIRPAQRPSWPEDVRRAFTLQYEVVGELWRRMDIAEGAAPEDWDPNRRRYNDPT